MKAGRAIIGIFQKMRIKNLRGRGVSEVRFKKIRLIHLSNVEKSPHPQFSAQRACEGEALRCQTAFMRQNLQRINFTHKFWVIKFKF